MRGRLVQPSRVGAVRDAVAASRLYQTDFPDRNTQAGAESGVDNGLLRFIPQISPMSDENLVLWTRVTSDYSSISEIALGLCEYSKVL